MDDYESPAYNFSDPIGSESGGHHFTLPLYAAIILGAVHLLYFLLGIITNVATLAKLWCCKQAGDRSNIRALDAAVSSLAVADLLIIGILVPVKFHVELHRAWLLGGFACALLIYVEALTSIVSLLTLIAAGVFLCVARRNAAYDGRAYAVKATVALVALWLLAAAVSVLWAVAAEHYAHERACVQHGPASTLLEVLAVALHCALYATLCCALARTADGEGSAVAVRKATKMVFTVALVKTICWLPFHLLIIVQPVVYLQLSSTVWTVIVFWSLTSSIVNYFVYKAFGYFTADLAAIETH